MAKAKMAKVTRRKVGARTQISIRKLDLRDGNARAEFEKILTAVDKKFKPVTDAIRDSQRLSKEDFSIRINTRR
jgi:hypothetical protein